MSIPASETTPGSQLAYVLSAVTTMLWVGCALPSGGQGVHVSGDLATPLHREPWLLVGALVLLVVGPVGVTLAPRRGGLLGVLATTDAFVCLYAATGLTVRGGVQGGTSGILVALLYGLAGLSLAESVRRMRHVDGEAVPPYLHGARLAICLLVLVLPSWILIQDGHELASLLAPFAFVAISTAGTTLARSVAGLQLTTALLHLLLAAHVLVSLRYTIFDGEPRLVRVNAIGWSTLGLAALVLLLTLLLVATRLRGLARAQGAGTPVPGSAS